MAGERVSQPIAIWKSKLPRCFKKLQDPSGLAYVYFFSNPKSWMQSETMEAVLARFNRKLDFEDGKVTLFLDNATCHPESIISQFLQIKIIFLLKNATSRLQPLDAGIIRISGSSTERDWLSMCSQRSRRMHLQHKLSRVRVCLWLFDGYKKRRKK